MLKPFAFLALFLLLFITAVMGHFLLYSSTMQSKKLLLVVGLTKIASPVLGSAFYAPRELFNVDISNPAYPQMQTINKMDFIYDK
jgi:hypothetical protein